MAMPGDTAGMIGKAFVGLLVLLVLVFGLPPAQAAPLAAAVPASLRHAYGPPDEAGPVATAAARDLAAPCSGPGCVHETACCGASPCAAPAGGLALVPAGPTVLLFAGRRAPPAALSEPAPGIGTAPALPPPRRTA
jgi:hypothetical protein